MVHFQSKTYDSATEKYLDFSFEKTNSAYMLFYERVEQVKDEVEAKEEAATVKVDVVERMELEKREVTEEEEKEVVAVAVKSEDQNMTEEGDDEKRIEEGSTTEKPDIECDIVDKGGELVKGDDEVKGNEKEEEQQQETQEMKEEVGDGEKEKKSTLDATTEQCPEVERSFSSGICKELEDWIWQDNKNFLQDVNVFEHTYFK